MAKEHAPHGYGLYWRIWLILLVFTVAMIFLDQISVPRFLLVTILVAAMLFKATLVAGYFMHLRYERLSLGLSVVFGLLFVGAVLYGLLVPDGVRILALSGR
jgi:cytochrome c oxidase subunit 4